MDCKEAIYSQDTADYFIQRFGELEMIQERYGFECILPLNNEYTVAFAKLGLRSDDMEFPAAYTAAPRCYGMMEEPGSTFAAEGSSAPALEAMGVSRLRRMPYLDLLGSGVLIGFVDSGIDYTHPVFRNADGSSRIYAIWDQTEQNGTPPEGFAYGAEYSRTQLTQALMAQDPYSVVPERDIEGHGTYAAGLAAGNIVRDTGFSGVAPLAEILMVKLKPAKQYLRELYLIPEDAVCYQETDLAWGVEYLVRTAQRIGRPLVICMTLGTNSGGHDGAGVLDRMLDGYASRYNICVVTATGNEAGYGLHYHSEQVAGEYEQVELKVGEREPGFTMELWASLLSQYSVAVISPTGELISRIPSRRNNSQVIHFLFENTRLYVDYFSAGNRTGNQLVLMRLQQPTEGIWRFLIYRDTVVDNGFDIWLPLRQFVQEDTYFLRPDPDITITDPGNAEDPITVASYRVADKSIYLHSGRGFTRTNRYKPDVAAPGVDIYGPMAGGGYRFANGGAAAAALTAGGCALVLEWAVGGGRQPQIRSQEIKRLLQGGAERTGIEVPSREWGYGRVDFYGAFEELRTVANI